MKPNVISGKGQLVLVVGLCCVIALAVVAAFFLFAGNKARVVGKNIAKEEITEFYYTEDSSTNPPRFLRYRFYTEDGSYWFYHEKREGNHWPLTESDITVSGAMKLTEEEWAKFFDYLNGGKVTGRGANTDTGNAGPWLYLYWNGDRSRFQEFSFAAYETRISFAAFCAELAQRCQ